MVKKIFKIFSWLVIVLLSYPCQTVYADDIVGNIKAPPGVEKWQGKGADIGIILFISQLIRIASIVAGVWVFINFILAGWKYITSAGDSKAHQEVADKITMSIIGIVIIVAAYAIAGLVGLLVFGDASYILNPKIQSVDQIIIGT